MAEAEIIPPRNKGGRPKGSVSKVTLLIRQVAQQHGAELIEGLMEIFRDKEQPANFRVMAAKEVLDRGYGKATQSHAHAVGTYDFSALIDEQLKATYEVLKLASPKTLDDTD
jgi:hypothetical protein